MSWAGPLGRQWELSVGMSPPASLILRRSASFFWYSGVSGMNSLVLCSLGLFALCQTRGPSQRGMLAMLAQLVPGSDKSGVRLFIWRTGGLAIEEASSSSLVGLGPTP